MKKILYVLLVGTISISMSAQAIADPTYAVLDGNGNVTNVIICGNACAGGEFGGNKVVLQVAANPVTGENRGGIWHGLGSTTYSNDGTFTVTYPGQTFSNTETDVDGNTVTSSVTISGPSASFTYEDTKNYDISIGTMLATKIENNNNVPATVSVSKGNQFESLNFFTRKTKNEVLTAAESLQLLLIVEKINTLESMLGSWIKK